MKRIRVIASIVTLGLVTLEFAAMSVAHATVEGTSVGMVHYSNSELRRLRRDAHTPEQYHALAGYYEEQQAFDNQQAASEKEEWARRSVNVSGPAAKYPRPVDSARTLYEYYASEAQRAGTLASHYEQLEQSSELGSTLTEKPSVGR